jgi:ABC-type uncharacterized transport system fused permease/ATPase subunit
LIAVIALAFFFVQLLKIRLDLVESLYLMLAGLGFFLAVISAFLLYIRKQYYSEEIDRRQYMSAASDFLVKWMQFENASRKQLASENNDVNKYSIRDIVSSLISVGKINPSDAIFLEDAMRFRNLLVHSGKQVSIEYIAQMTEALNQITTSLKPKTTIKRKRKAHRADA